ncbi:MULTISPECIES: ABC transporter permease [unclassified Pseudovibrio]|uniref:ABC transporter permease n=1 Tax=unclassified Pseudovibrio TaxID=2627060 RepID=UPI0007AE9D8C|nr:MULTISPECIES: ABC transporter permease [unclassified Pseudovibrio]KZK92081.1 Glutathione transport system permease protein GsiD [Pseudovibrio sp. Ad5]KZK94994.1 Glutathione transport system permease protein GsiD [Pseudovibrio sp. W74]KZL08797.1 Glutathione transport system permease protein GsiD [Pseudovibrio sp. Ad14]
MNQELPSYPPLASFDEISIWKKAFHSRSFVIGAVLALVILIAGVTSLFWTPYAIDVLDVSKRLKPMSSEFWFGTDQYGRDIFSMLMVGARTSIIVALIAVGIGMLIGVPLGLLAAAQKGFLEELVMRTNDLIFAFPSLLSAVLITSIFGPGTINAVIAIGIFNIPVFARVARGGALSLSGREFLLAARLSGKSSFLITLEHVIPNIANLLIVQATIQLSLAILSEAGLSYLGLGTQPPMASWGRMLYEAQTMVAFAPQLALYPGFAIIFSVLGFNLLGDGLRDLLDPKMRRRVA